MDLGLGLFIIHQNIRFQETKTSYCIKNLIKTSYQELNETKDQFKIWACEIRDATSDVGYCRLVFFWDFSFGKILSW